MAVANPPKQEETKKELEKKIERVDNANKNDRQAMFNVYLFDPVSKTSQMEKFVSIGSINNVKSTTLAKIRASLISEKALSWRQKSSRFCNDQGAEVEDKLSFDLYLNFLNNTEEEPGGSPVSNDENDDDAPNKRKKARGNDGQPVTADTDAGKSYKVYLKLRKLPTEVDETTRELLKKELDLQMARPDTISAEVNKLTSSYNHKDFMALAAKTVTHPADMGEREWYIVLQNNSILHGNYVRQLPNGQTKVERAMYPAFALKPRKFLDYEVSNSGDIGEEGGKTRPSSEPRRSEDPVVHQLRIPRFLVQDDSYINVSENKSSVADAIADSSLSEDSAEVSISGGAFGYSAAAKVGYKKDESNNAASKRQTDTNRMTITYNFPRVVLELDGDSLDLSDECKTDLEAVNTKEGVQYFRRKYGTFFSTRVELGGRLHSSESSDSFAETEVQKKARSLKISAAASFSSPYVQGSASGSYGTSSSNSSDHQNSSLNKSLSWEAKGGDTLLCNNPPAWCGTVASYYNWRISKQEDLLSIEDMISIIPEYGTTKGNFQALDPSKVNGIKNKVNPPPKEWDGKVTFWLKAPNESLYPTVVKGPDPNSQALATTPGQVEWLREIMNMSSYCLKMEGAKSDNSQVFHAGYKFFEIRDRGTVYNRFKLGHKYLVIDNNLNEYLGVTPPCPGGPQTSFLNAGTKDNSAYFQFTHAYENDKVYIGHNDLVRVEISDSAGRLIGPLKNVPPLGSYGTTGDIFTFRYKGEP